MCPCGIIKYHFSQKITGTIAKVVSTKCYSRTLEKFPPCNTVNMINSKDTLNIQQSCLPKFKASL